MNLLTDHLEIWTGADNDKKSGRGRASGSAASVYGVKKLRELILELAVRGKLVPQEASDEPASELLKRIAAEKAKSIKEGKIKAQKPLAEIGEDEKPFELPMGWEWVRLGSLGFCSTGSTPNTQNSAFYGVDIPFIGPAQITPNNILLSADKWLSEKGRKETTIANSGDILMVCIGGSIGKSAITDKEVSFNQQINCISPILAFSNYIHFSMQSPHFQMSILEAATGSATPIINRTKWEDLLIAISPLAEQHRIVAKVDELMTLCDQLENQHSNAIVAHEKLVSYLLNTLTQTPVRPELVVLRQAQHERGDFNLPSVPVRPELVEGLSGSTSSPRTDDFAESWQRIAANFDTLFNTESSIDALKQTVLQLAVMGKLVPQDVNDEPASELLKRIQAEKAKLIAEGKIKKDKQLAVIADDEKPFELPKGWEWARLNNVLDVRDGTHDSPKDAEGDDTYPLVTSKNFSNGEINFDEARKISAVDHFEISKRSRVERFDILFSMIGGNIGNQVLVNDEREFSIKNVALFKYYDRNYTSPFFIKKFLEHLAIDLQTQAAGGAQPFVSLGFLRTVLIGVPPINEQHRIVAKVDELMAICDQLKTRITTANQLQQKLADVLVGQAVGGS